MTKKFIAKTTKSNLPVNINSQAIPSALKQFDLNKLNLVSLSKELEASLNSSAPQSVLFGWAGLKRQKLKTEHQRNILDHIYNIRRVNEELCHLQAELFLSPQTIELLIEGKRLEAEHKIQLAVKEQEAKLHALSKEMEAREVNLDHMREVVRNLKADTDAKTARIELMRKVVDSIDLNELPDYLRAFVIASVFNPNQPITQEMSLMDDLKDFMIQKASGEARKTQAQAGREEAQEKIERTTAQKTEDDYARLRDSSKGK